MAKIHIKVSTGEEYTISNAFYGADGAMDVRGAVVQMGFLVTKMATVMTDQHVTVNTAHIVYEWVSE